MDAEPPKEPDAETLDDLLERTVEWWREWASSLRLGTRDEPAARRSGIVLKALTYAPTGAIAAAPTTSLPEAVGGARNWDYRYAWVRDSSFSSRALAELGAVDEADAFRAFIMRSAAGHAEDLQIVYGVAGERRLRGDVVEELDGYRKSTPVRVGNDAAEQIQLDAYGELVNLTWRWHRRGHSPSDDDWRFLVSLIDHAAERCHEPDCGIWEWPGDPDHFVHSKVLCWSALDRGIRLADECMRRGAHATLEAGPRRAARGDRASAATTANAGSTSRRSTAPTWTPRCCCCPRSSTSPGTTSAWSGPSAAIREELDAGDGLLYRYRRDDGLEGDEGAFLCCSFWLAECLARAGDPARRATCSTRPWPGATTSGCSPRRSIRAPASCSGTSRRG